MKCRKGFTLLEILTATVVMAIVLLTATSILYLVSESHARTAAVASARNRIESAFAAVDVPVSSSRLLGLSRDVAAFQGGLVVGGVAAAEIFAWEGIAGTNEAGTELRLVYGESADVVASGDTPLSADQSVTIPTSGPAGFLTPGQGSNLQSWVVFPTTGMPFYAETDGPDYIVARSAADAVVHSSDRCLGLRACVFFVRVDAATGRKFFSRRDVGGATVDLVPDVGAASFSYIPETGLLSATVTIPVDGQSPVTETRSWEIR
jgi:prepilin-type N-terminal cleavage/methylation domain-containing protein